MYGKIFASLWDGTIATKWPVWSTFVYMIANCDRGGEIVKTQEAISAATGIPLELVMQAIQHLESPDPRSRTRDHEGRRIERLEPERDWGWKILNYELYRGMRDEETRREQNRRAQQRRRDRHPESAAVSHGQPRSAHAEAEAEERRSTPPAPRSADADSPPAAAPPFLILQSTSGDWPLSQQQLEAWRKLFPGISVEQECRNASAWLDANPKNRKTPGGMKRFLTAWLTRSQNSARPSGSPVQPVTPPRAVREPPPELGPRTEPPGGFDAFRKEIDRMTRGT